MARIIRQLDQIVSPEAKMRKLNTEPFVFLEGPVWDAKRKCLFFTDPLDSSVIAMSKEGHFQVVAKNTGYANGMCLSPDNHFAICKMDVGAIWKLNAETGELIMPLAEQYEKKPFNATNDVIADGKGGYYFTDPFFTFGPHTQPFEATFHCSSTGEIRIAATESVKPNGLVLSPDGKVLYIDDTGSSNVWKYNVEEDGSLTNATVFCQLNTPANAAELPSVQQYGEADGMKVDSLGNLYVTTYDGIQVFNPLGEYIGCIQMPGEESAANLAFGGADLCTMYITARTSLYALDILIPGIV